MMMYDDNENKDVMPFCTFGAFSNLVFFGSFHYDNDYERFRGPRMPVCMISFSLKKFPLETPTHPPVVRQYQQLNPA